MKTEPFDRLVLSEELRDILSQVEVVLPESRDHLLELAYLESDEDHLEVAYDVPDKGRVVEATVTRCRNGAAVNYPEPYMRRRDPEAMVIADKQPTDKPKWKDRFDGDFDPVRAETFDWFKDQGRLIVLPFLSGDKKRGYPTRQAGCSPQPPSRHARAVCLQPLPRTQRQKGCLRHPALHR
jgi:hypothetical protein